MGIPGRNEILLQNSDSMKWYADHLVNKYGKDGKISVKQAKKLLFGDNKLTKEQKMAFKQLSKLDGEKGFTSMELQTLMGASIISQGVVKNPKALDMPMDDLKSIYGILNSSSSPVTASATATTEDGDWNQQTIGIPKKEL